jgi:MFS family permease
MSKQQSMIPPSIGKTKTSAFFYGYIIVLCSFLVLMISFGTNYSFGVFFNRLLDDLGWSRAVTSVGYAMAQFIGGFMGIITGRLSDRFGPRLVIMSCILFLALGCFAMSTITQPWQLNIFFGLFMGIGFGGVAIPASVTTSRWFVKYRGIMTGIVVAGIGTGTIVMPVVAERLITAFDWRNSFIIFGFIALAVGIPTAYFLKRDPSTVGALAYGEKIEESRKRVAGKETGLTFKQAIHTRQFWVFCITCILFGFFVQGILLHIVPHARSLKIEAGTAAYIISFLGLGSIGGRVVLGLLSDRIGVKNTLLIALSLALLSFIWLLFAVSPWMLFLFALVYGLGYGALITMMTLMPARIFGLISLGTLVGVITFVYTAGGAIGSIVTGYIFDVTQSYRLAFFIFISLCVCALILASTLKQDIHKKDHTN